MEYVMKCANWNVRCMAVRYAQVEKKKNREEYLLRNWLKYRQSQNKKQGIECYTEKNSYTVTCSDVNSNTAAEANIKIWIYKSFNTQL